MRIEMVRRALLLSSACLIGVTGVAFTQDFDIEEGEYLTEEAYQKLSGDEALDYCEKLAQEIDLQNDNAAAANSMMSDIEAEIADLKNQLADAKSMTNPLAGEIASLEARLRELRELPRSYTVKEGDFLIKIAGMSRIYGDGSPSAWKRLYRANRDKIDDPNLIYPGQVLLIPRGMLSSYTVMEGDSLGRIAGFHEVYGDRSQWNRIYDANRGAIGSDPNMLRPGMVLSIPR